MMPYVIILSLAFLLAGVELVRLRSQDKVWLFAAMIAVMVLLAGLRGPYVDRDYGNYQIAFGYMQYLPWKDILSAYSIYNMELGYILLTKIFSSAGFSFAGFLFVYELVTGIVLARLIYKYSPYPLITLCLYVSLFYFIRDFTQIRFALACLLMLFGLFKHSEGERSSGLALLVCAGLLHNAVWIALMIPLSYSLFYNRWLYLAFPPLGYIVSLFHPMYLIARFVGLPEQISRYMIPSVRISSGLMGYLFAFLLMVFGVFHYKKLRDLFGVKFDYLFIALSLGVFLGLMFLNFPIMQRVSGALITAAIFYIAFVIKMLAEKKWYGYRDVFAFSVLLMYLYYGFRFILVARILKPYF